VGSLRWPVIPAERAFNKPARTFAVQLQALKRYRTGGEQKVTVQHVMVNGGEKAIVGVVAQTAGGMGHDRKSEGQPGASATRLAHDVTPRTGVPTLRSEDAERERVPVTSNGEWPL
jgi:hypothetical protein